MKDASRHADERIAEALEAWGYADYDLHPYHVARLLFPDFESLARVYTELLPAELHDSFHRVSRATIGGKQYDIRSIMNYIALLDTMPETLAHATVYLRAFGLEWPVSWTRTYREFGALCEGDAAYLNALSLDKRHQEPSIIRTLNELQRRGVPAEYVRTIVEAQHPTLVYSGPDDIELFYREGLPAAVAATYNTGSPRWPAERIIELYRGGVSGEYADATSGSWGQGLPGTDASVAIYLHQAGIPLWYAEMGTSLKMPLPDIVECYRAGVPAEYLTAL
jgi:hypothetical protein